MEVLKRMGKSISPSRAKETVHIANRLRFKTQTFYILGSPCETKKQMLGTIRFSREVDSTLAFYNMLVPFPGTRDFQYFFSSTPLKDIDWEKFVAIGQDCVLKNSQVPPGEIEKLIGKANMLYYANPRRLLNLLLHIRTFYELGNYCQGGIALCRQITKWFGGKTKKGNN